jgi:galactoside O-acetyltransferase/dTDP-4-amino-4,6-dideoxygalactose transaminase
MRRPIVSANIRLRQPELLTIGEGSIIDDFCYFSTRINVGRFCHIASGCSIAGGSDRLFVLGDFSSLSSGVKVWCTSDDYSRDVVTIIPPEFGPIKEHLITADVIFGGMTAVGANSVIMPGNTIPDGTVIGALSFVPAYFQFDPWSVYAGIPVRKIDRRDRDAVLRQVEAFEAHLLAERDLDS